MSVGDFCTREVIVARADEPIQTAARLMRQHHVGDVIVVEERHGRRFPVGVVTDRDLAIEILDSDLDPDTVVIGDLITAPAVSARERDSLADTVHRMRERGIRRMPVTDEAGALVGVVSMDDVIELIGEEVGELSALIRRERARERDTRSRPPPTA